MGRKVFDPTVQSYVGIGDIVGSFTVSGEFGVSVYYQLDQYVLNTLGQMSGMIEHGPYSSGSPASGSLGGGGQIVDWAQMQTNYTVGHPTISGGGQSFLGMVYEPFPVLTGPSGSAYASGYAQIGVWGTQAFKLIRQVYYSGTVNYYPDAVAHASGLASVSTLKLL